MDSVRLLNQAVSKPLPLPVRERSETIQGQVDSLSAGTLPDSKPLAKNLLELCREVRQQQPLARDTLENRVKAQAVARTLGWANKIAEFASAATAPGANGPVVLRNLQEANRQFQLSLRQTYGVEGTAPLAKVGAPPPPDFLEWVEVPGGTFLMGPDKKPVDVPTFWIGKYPVTEQQYATFVESTGHPSVTDFQMRDPDHPAAVDFHDARAFCQWAGVQLPNEAQWEKAGRGTDGRNFPWGNEWDPSACNHDGGGTESVHQHEDTNVSPYGAVDMTGNVYNWIDDSTVRRPGAVMMKGGAWGNYARSDRQHYDLAHHTSIMPNSFYGGCGFRPIRTTPPESMGKPGPSTAQTPQVNALPEGPLAERVEKLIQGQKAEFEPLMAGLAELCQTVKASCPQGITRQAATLLATANHVATGAAFMATGSPAAAATMDVCKRDLKASMSSLFGQVAEFPFASEVQAVTLSPGNVAGVEWVAVPAGSFLYGRDNQSLQLAGFELSKYPVTNEQYRTFVSETGYHPKGGWRLPASGEDSEWADHPAVHVTHSDAEAYCRWAGGYLPSEEQWEKAARGTDGRMFPWGNNWVEGACNNALGGTTSVHKFESVNVSPYGAVDMVGNVLEYTSSAPSDRPGAVLTKGGAWHNFGTAPFNCVRHTSEPIDMAHGACGFRVARDLRP